jgi:hypothetical protein
VVVPRWARCQPGVVGFEVCGLFAVQNVQRGWIVGRRRCRMEGGGLRVLSRGRWGWGGCRRAARAGSCCRSVRVVSDRGGIRLVVGHRWGLRF